MGFPRLQGWQLCPQLHPMSREGSPQSGGLASTWGSVQGLAGPLGLWLLRALLRMKPWAAPSHPLPPPPVPPALGPCGPAPPGRGDRQLSRASSPCPVVLLRLGPGEGQGDLWGPQARAPVSPGQACTGKRRQAQDEWSGSKGQIRPHGAGSGSV